MTTNPAPDRRRPSAEASPDDVLVVDDLVRRYGDLTAVGGVSFRIAPGETYGLLGPNGAGKTTIISMVAGLIPADEGTITVLGHPVRPTRIAVKRHIGLVPQELAIYPELSGRENPYLNESGPAQATWGRRRMGLVVRSYDGA